VPFTLAVPEIVGALVFVAMLAATFAVVALNFVSEPYVFVPITRTRRYLA